VSKAVGPAPETLRSLQKGASSTVAALCTLPINGGVLGILSTTKHLN